MPNENMIENVDCVTINGNVLTVAHVNGMLNEVRRKYFDLDLVATPVVSVSRYAHNAEEVTGTQKELLDNSPFEFDDSVGERRFRTEFDYYAALIRAAEDNADQIYQLKRKMTARVHVLTARYADLYDMCLHDYGSKTMGSNDKEREAWFHMKYPALFEIARTYENFLEEIEIELKRWEQFSSAASRQLTATETSYKATGRLFDRHSGRYAIH